MNMSIISNVKQTLMHYTWDLAYFNYSPEIIGKPLRFENLNIVINPYKKKWFADPFILSNNEKELQLLVEEFDSSVMRGRIARIAIDKSTNTIIECSIVLDLPTHLSFPAIYRENGKIFVTPENSASGALYIYEYNRETDKLESKTLLHPEPLTDAIIDKYEKVYRMYATCLPSPNGNELSIYEANALMGPYTKLEQHLLDNNTARMAGYIIHDKDRVLRPAQDCSSGDYGKAVVFYDGSKEIGRFSPQGFKYSGLHTINTYKEIGIIDLKKYDYPYIYRLRTSIKRK